MNDKYKMIVWWSSDDSAYVVEVPELPGCMAHGATRAEAVINGEEAISIWVQTAIVDNVSVPAPKSYLVAR